jgi:maleylpyruvate isomerase
VDQVDRLQLCADIDQATQRLLDDARIITEPDLRAPSLLPGWTRAHVLAHLARGADAMRNLMAGARSGQDRPAYASAQARADDIEASSRQRPEQLAADLADSAMALRTVSRQLPEQAWQVPVRILGSAPFPAAQLLTRRLVEIELHHCDLGVGYGPDDWPAASAALELPEPMRSQRRDRVEAARARPPVRYRPRPVPGYRPGQRIPGSLL